MQPSGACSEGLDLRERAAETRKLYISAVAALNHVSTDQEEATNDRVEAARVLYLKARTAVLEHEKTHRCGFQPESELTQLV